MDRRVDVRHFVHRRSCDISSSNMAAYERWPRVSGRGTKYSSEVCRMGRPTVGPTPSVYLAYTTLSASRVTCSACLQVRTSSQMLYFCSSKRQGISQQWLQKDGGIHGKA